MNSAAAHYITIANWNVGGARILPLVSEDPLKRRQDVKPPPPNKSREYVRNKLNSALTYLLRTRPEIVTLQEVVRYAADGREENAEDVLNIQDCYLTCNDVKYKYYPHWLVDNRRHLAQGKWKKVIETGGWITEDCEPFFAQGNAILVRDDFDLYPVWGLQGMGIPPPEDPQEKAPGAPGDDAAKNAKGHRFIEHVPLQPGLYFGDRDTEPRAASVAHLVLSKLTAGERHPDPLDVPLDIFIVNVHLTTLTMERVGVPEVDMAAEHTRLRQLEIILKQIVSSYNRWRCECYPIRGDHWDPELWETHTRHNPIWIIAGDLNFTPDSNEYDAMVRGGFIDLIPHVFKKDPTRRPHTKASGTEKPPTHTLDYVFVGPRFHSIDPLVAEKCSEDNQVLRQECYGLSDHYPLLFKVPTEPGEPCKCKYC